MLTERAFYCINKKELGTGDHGKSDYFYGGDHRDDTNLELVAQALHRFLVAEETLYKNGYEGEPLSARPIN